MTNELADYYKEWIEQNEVLVVKSTEKKILVGRLINYDEKEQCISLYIDEEKRIETLEISELSSIKTLL
ncbi:hypothetical protein [Cytobacillus firmus]|uniref:Uncharacterized protein n=1 Tax=Cytobacillus firmus DS1 TaxID=1307436 RepID=W7L442_CYTFI|nr:hypothetical protein [Cytobacillus firmus]EWG09932.1 hypothetical protein PBF_16174 [Cytobacillus firmus DS1]